MTPLDEADVRLIRGQNVYTGNSQVTLTPLCVAVLVLVLEVVTDVQLIGVQNIYTNNSPVLKSTEVEKEKLPPGRFGGTPLVTSSDWMGIAAFLHP